VGLTASSEHALGGRLIDWRRAHALVCPEWPRWAATKGLRLDDRGALLYPNETGPYEPKSRTKAEEEGVDEDGFVDEEHSNGLSEAALEPEHSNGLSEAALEPGQRNGLVEPAFEPEPEPRIDLMAVPAEDLEQAELF
jgi:hypothetical protein